MSEKKRYKSDAFASIHETMDSLFQIGAVDKKTMREFDESCLETASEADMENFKKDHPPLF